APQQVAALVRVALLERDAREPEQGARVVGVVSQHPAELLPRGRGGAARDVQVGGEQVRVVVVGIELEHARHERRRLGITALAPPLLGAPVRLRYRLRLAPAARRPQPHDAPALMRASRARPLPRASRPPPPCPCPPGAASSCLPSAAARRAPRSRRHWGAYPVGPRRPAG